MKPDLHNPYGYKICYKEKGSKELVTTFMVHSYKKAKYIKEMYAKLRPVYTYPNEKPLKKPTWFIIPITRKEVRDGIWRQCPF